MRRVRVPTTRTALFRRRRTRGQRGPRAGHGAVGPPPQCPPLTRPAASDAARSRRARSRDGSRPAPTATTAPSSPACSCAPRRRARARPAPAPSPRARGRRRRGGSATTTARARARPRASIARVDHRAHARRRSTRTSRARCRGRGCRCRRCGARRGCRGWCGLRGSSGSKPNWTIDHAGEAEAVAQPLDRRGDDAEVLRDQRQLAVQRRARRRRTPRAPARASTPAERVRAPFGTAQ